MVEVLSKADARTCLEPIASLPPNGLKFHHAGYWLSMESDENPGFRIGIEGKQHTQVEVRFGDSSLGAIIKNDEGTYVGRSGDLRGQHGTVTEPVLFENLRGFDIKVLDGKRYVIISELADPRIKEKLISFAMECDRIRYSIHPLPASPSLQARVR